MTDEIANAAKLLSEPARAAMLVKLMDGRSLPAGELALAARVSPQTASEHLARLTEAGFVAAQRRGRHRYYSLANEEAAYAIESLMVLSASPRDPVTPAPGSVQHARTCYAHLAGWLGVKIVDALQREDYLAPQHDKTFALTAAGAAWFERQGIALPRSLGAAHRTFSRQTGPGRAPARQCLDWTERRSHLAGPSGVALYKRFVQLRWNRAYPQIARTPDHAARPRSLQRELHIVVG